MKLGAFFKSWVMRGFGPGSWQDLGGSLVKSWAAHGHLGRLLGGSWAVLGGSWALLGCSWAAPGPSLAALGRLLGYLGLSWAALGRSWRSLGRSWAALERSWAPSWSQDGAQKAQHRPQDPPKSRPRRSKIALICKTIFRTPFWELPESFGRPFCRMLGGPGAQKSLKNL